MPDFLSTPAFWFSLFGVGFTVFAYFHKLSRDAAQEAQADLKNLKTRVSVVEDVDKTAYPQFQKLLLEHAATQTTLIHLDQRIQGTYTYAEKGFEIMELKVANHDKDIREIKDCISKLEQKFDKNTDRIIEQIARLTEKIH